jgi:hypothetical protein
MARMLGIGLVTLAAATLAGCQNSGSNRLAGSTTQPFMAQQGPAPAFSSAPANRNTGGAFSTANNAFNTPSQFPGSVAPAGANTGLPASGPFSGPGAGSTTNRPNNVTITQPQPPTPPLPPFNSTSAPGLPQLPQLPASPAGAPLNPPGFGEPGITPIP